METSISDPELHSVYWYSGKEAARMDLRYGQQDTPLEAALAVVLHVHTWNLEGMAWWAGYLTRAISGDPWFCDTGGALR